MTKIWFMGCILCTFLLLPVAVSADGNITITSTPAGATMIVDSVTQSGVTPKTLYNVNTGPHTILLRLTGYADAWVNITVTGDQTVTASLSAIATTMATTATPAPVVNGSISFESRPANANVYINSVLKGYTPITVYNITPGSYSVKIQKTGYLIYANRFNVTSGNTTTVYATLTAEPTDAPTMSATTASQTTAITTATPKKTATTKAITPWPTSTPTQQSPVPLAVCISALGVGLLVLRKK